jgi:hypothetical protein
MPTLVNQQSRMSQQEFKYLGLLVDDAGDDDDDNDDDK